MTFYGLWDFVSSFTYYWHALGAYRLLFPPVCLSVLLMEGWLLGNYNINCVDSGGLTGVSLAFYNFLIGGI